MNVKKENSTLEFSFFACAALRYRMWLAQEHFVENHVIFAIASVDSNFFCPDSSNRFELFRTSTFFKSSKFFESFTSSKLNN
ncbi:hypothetical protein JOC58_001831 [Paenibacillus hunanensis]|uniref:Uncharacterized protein n=1 Tax=Paenibacillus hunanensis TaxID=539262 RepID=A0ABU1J0D8_9BACL|nr:hypothetical protein [Paenibacillus hunanensis]